MTTVTVEQRKNRSAATQRWREKFPEKQRALALLTHYSLSWEDYVKMYESQQGMCAICSVNISPYKGGIDKVARVDHNHTTGKVRGLLCSGCNTAIGLLKDCPVLVSKAEAYLQKDINDSN